MTPSTVLAAQLIGGVRPSLLDLAKPSLLAVSQMSGVCRHYVNVSDPQHCSPAAVRAVMADFAVPYQVEGWQREGWGEDLNDDRDQRRLLKIVHSRNMAIDYALYQGSEWLLFIDADVVPGRDGLECLLTLNRPLCGGLVPGRGDHSGVSYVFPGEMAVPGWDLPVTEEGSVLRCGFGTCGYMLIHRSIFAQLRFRFNPLAFDPPDGPGCPAIAEDPAFCYDAVRLGLTDAFYVARAATADHL